MVKTIFGVTQWYSFYCLALKGNQGNIHEDVEQLLEYCLAQKWQNIDYSFFQTTDKDHGPIETRRYWTMDNVEYLLDSDKWKGIESIGMVESQRTIDGETTWETRYYLHSFASNAEVFAHAVRSHWGIENSLHWRLDIGFREDDCRIRKFLLNWESICLSVPVSVELLPEVKGIIGSNFLLINNIYDLRLDFF